MTLAPSVPHVVVVGAGFGGLESAFYLRKRLGKRVKLTVVNESDTWLFKPNLIYVPFGKEVERYVHPLRPAFDARGIAFVEGRAEGVDTKAKRVVVGKDALAYDYLMLATGATMRPSEIAGLEEHARTIWTPKDVMELRVAFAQLVEQTLEGASRRVLFMVPPNNKCSGPLYEMVMMLDTWLRRKGVRDRVELSWATYEKGYIQAFGPRLNELVTHEFEERGIAGRKSAPVEKVERGAVVFQDGTRAQFDLLVSFPPYVAATRYAGLPADERGFLRTDTGTRQLDGQPDVYAVGDAGDFPVKQAFLALLQADAAAEHLSERILGEDPVSRFDPVSMCIMEQFDKATFAQVPLELTGDPALPVRVRESSHELYRVGSGELWRYGKKMLGALIPQRFAAGRPFHAGASWAALEAGLKVMIGGLTT